VVCVCVCVGGGGVAVCVCVCVCVCCGCVFHFVSCPHPPLPSQIHRFFSSFFSVFEVANNTACIAIEKTTF
jgi:hypothetical protein